MRKLQVAYSRKEKLEKLIASLENLKKEGQVTARQYNSIKKDYDHLYTEATKAVEDIRADIKKDLEGKQLELKNLKQDLGNLAVRFKIGEMPEAEYKKSQEKINKAIQKSQEEIADLKALLNAKTSADVGGYVEVKTEAPKGLASIFGEGLSSGLQKSGASSGKGSFRPSFFTLILGIVIFISVFLPWVSVDIGFGMNETANGTESGWGVLSLIMGICCALLSFVSAQKIKGVGLIAAGILAVIGAAAYWFSFSGDWGMFAEILSPSFGLFITILAAIVVAIVGLVDYRRAV